MITHLHLLNYGPFRGEHRLELGPGAYSVVAQRDDDRERSNACGKSVTLGAARHALYNAHGWQHEDDWITNGELEGAVGVTVKLGDDWLMASRTRARGKSTQLSLSWSQGGEQFKASGQKAEPIVEEFLNLSLTDFDASVFMLQKQASRFVTAPPGDRLATVRGWLRLDRFDDCLAATQSHLNAAAQRAEHARQELQGLRDARASLLTDLAAHDEGDHVERLTKLRQACAQEELRAARLADEARANYDAHTATRVAADRAAQYARLAAEGIRLRADLGDLDQVDAIGRLEAELAQAEWSRDEMRAQADAVKQERTQVKAITQLGFDGRCPVMQAPCPAAREVTAAVQRDAKRVEDLDARWAKAEEDRAGAEEACRKIRHRLDVTRAGFERLSVMRERVRELHPDRNAPLYDETKAEELRAAAYKAAEDKGRYAQVGMELTRAIQRVEQWAKREAELVQAVQEAERDVDAIRAASVAFRRAERDVVESSLAGIADAANEALATGGIDLSVAVSWTREGQALADACQACGSVFPRSQRVRICNRCAEPRGPKLQHRLDVIPTPRSGALEDLAGVAFQIAASRWLRGSRGCAWSSAFLDEPLAACDPVYRKRIMTWLASSAMGSMGLAQLFVISHSSELHDMFPHHLVVRADAHGDSRLEVM